jgi:predicted nucleic acid-binding Zn ribbon protein
LDASEFEIAMANRNSKERLSKAEYDEMMSQRERQRSRRSQRVFFAIVSVLVLASMIVSLFVRF